MSKQTENAIVVSNVRKSFRLPHEKNSSIKSIVLNPFKKRTFEKQEVLKGIDFKIKKGEFFGIVGRNGSGKSTLLKLLAGIYSPDSGAIQINGKLTPFIELGVGFNPELTGKENVFLNGALLGFSRKEMLDMYDEIVEFAELEKFMDQKLKNYSSGMQVRLAFSIAIRANTDILLLDEVLAVGDTNFQQKCFDYFAELKEMKKTVILVSHDRNALEKYCDKGVLINDGNILEHGPMDRILRKYNEVVLDGMSVETKKEKKVTHRGIVEIKDIFTANGSKKSSKFSYGTEITIGFSAKFKQDVDNPIFGVTVWDADSTKPVLATNTYIENKSTGKIKKLSTISFEAKLPGTLNDSRYYFEVAVANSNGTIALGQSEKKEFIIAGSLNPYSTLSFNQNIILKAVK